MNKRDILELKRRLKGDKCNINRLAGCYVDGTKNKVVQFTESFLNLETGEYEKYLELARKLMSGTIGNHILELSFPAEELKPGGRQQFLNGLKASNLENDELLDMLYDLIIKSFRYDGNFLILVFHDVYDIMTKTTDNMKLDESEEVYEYILVAVCPVVLSKPGLGYLSGENRIGARIRDWVVGAPELGFLYPAFDDRSADLNRGDFFLRDPKDAHPDFTEEVLSCDAKRTSTEKKQIFQVIVRQAFRQDEEEGEKTLLELTESLQLKTMAEEEKEEAEDRLSAPIPLDEALLQDILSENEVAEEPARRILENMRQEFTDEPVAVKELVDTKALNAYAPVKRERELVKEVESLKAALKGTEDYDVVLRVSEPLEAQIRFETIDEQKYIMVPLTENASVSVNGKNRSMPDA
ncbi:MAG: DUF4317 domain-containing protein [Lachnospiraceae bacterium]|nr:DUF4317 domain-containing protein [Lachnospiraceae bacterium]